MKGRFGFISDEEVVRDHAEKDEDQEVESEGNEKDVPECETDHCRTVKLIAAVSTVDSSITPAGVDETHGTVMAWKSGGIRSVRIEEVACTVTQARVHV